MENGLNNIEIKCDATRVRISNYWYLRIPTTSWISEIDTWYLEVDTGFERLQYNEAVELEYTYQTEKINNEHY